MNKKALYNLSYGLFVLSVKGEKHTGCITNTFMQVTSDPFTAVLAVNKSNYTHDVLMNTKKCSISVLTTDVPFSLIEQFGFKSGRDCDKFEGTDCAEEAENGIKFINRYANAVIFCEVTGTADFGSHTLFTVKIADAEKLSEKPSCTYEYYQSNIKPKPAQKSKGWQCSVCGYIYEGEQLPKDFICPLCKHPASDFVKL